MSYSLQAPKCMYCQKQAVIELTPEEGAQYERLKSGEIRFIQDAFPQWSADQRELLITGTHPECWDAIFEDDEEEDDYDREDELEDDEDE